MDLILVKLTSRSDSKTQKSVSYSAVKVKYGENWKRREHAEYVLHRTKLEHRGTNEETNCTEKKNKY